MRPWFAPLAREVQHRFPMCFPVRTAGSKSAAFLSSPNDAGSALPRGSSSARAYSR